jgi:hypothetical protein
LGGSKQISSQCVIGASVNFFECAADVLPGSSGSPVFSNWQLAGITRALYTVTGTTACISMRAILKCIGADISSEEFLDKHRTLFRADLNCHLPGSEWEWVKSPSKLQPIDLWLPPTTDEQQCVLLVGIPRGVLQLRTSPHESKLPALIDGYKEISGTSVLITKERVVTLTSSSFSTVNFRLKVLQVLLMSVPTSSGVKATFDGEGSIGKKWFCLQNCKGKQIRVSLSVGVAKNSAVNELPMCFLSVHSKDDLIVFENTEKISHSAQFDYSRTCNLDVHPTRDRIFVLVFWVGKGIPNFELIVRPVVPAAGNYVIKLSVPFARNLNVFRALKLQ